DHANHLIEARKWDSDPDENEEAVLELEADYKYEVFGNRSRKIVDADGEGGASAVTTKFAQDGWNTAKGTPVGNENWDVLADLNGDGSLASRYLRGDVVDELF